MCIMYALGMCVLCIYVCTMYVCTIYVYMFVCNYVNGPCEQSRNKWARRKPCWLVRRSITRTATERFNQLVL